MKANFFFSSQAFARYLIKSGSLHSIHSPFVYSLIEEVLNPGADTSRFQEVSDLRKSMLRKKYLIEITDYGGGKNMSDYTLRFESMSSIVKRSAINEKFGKILFRVVNHFKPLTILELGTSVGFSSMYMALANPSAQIFTIEGCPKKAEQALSNFNTLQISNIEQHIGRFDIILPELLGKVGKLDLAFIDGNHTYKATLRYFDALMKIAHNDTILIFDDIHWSKGMEDAWSKITVHPQVSVSIDLFRIGIVFLKQELSKQKFVIRL